MYVNRHLDNIDMTTNSEKSGKNVYIDNTNEPEDYKIVFMDNSLYKKFERKVNNLSGSQEKVLEEAIENGDLYIIVDNIKRYPDNHRYQKMHRLYYVIFTLNIDAKQAEQIQYSPPESIDKDDLQSYGKSAEKFEAKVHGLRSEIPSSSIEVYLKKLIHENITLRYLNINGKRIEICGTYLRDNIPSVYGWDMNDESSSSSSQLAVTSLHNEGCRNMSNPEKAYERWVGKAIGIPDKVSLETWFASHRDSPYLKANINGVLLAPDHLEISTPHPTLVYHVPIEEERLKSSIQPSNDQMPNRADADAGSELAILSSSSSTSSIASSSSTTIKPQGNRLTTTVKKIKTVIGKSEKIPRNRSSSAVAAAPSQIVNKGNSNS